MCTCQYVCVISVSQGDLASFSCVMFISCLAEGYALSLLLLLSLLLQPFRRLVVEAKKDKIQGYIASLRLSLVPVSGQTIDGP